MALSAYSDFNEYHVLVHEGRDDVDALDEISRSRFITAERTKQCVMCGHKLQKQELEPSKSFRQYLEALNQYEDTRWSGADIMYKWRQGSSWVRICRNCGWWSLTESTFQFEWYSTNIFITQGSIRRFNVSNLDVPIGILRDFLAANPSAMESVDPFVFERLIAECLRVEFGPCEVFHVGSRGGAGDGGIDIILFREHDEWLVQVKRRKGRRKEGVEAVRQLNGVLLREGQAKGMLISTAIGYTPKAIEETKVRTKTPVPYQVELISRGGIERMLTNPGHESFRGWEIYLDIDLSQLSMGAKPAGRHFRYD